MQNNQLPTQSSVQAKDNFSVSLFTPIHNLFYELKTLFTISMIPLDMMNDSNKMPTQTAGRG